MKVLNLIAQILIVIGAINWGLVGAFDVDLVQMLFGGLGLVDVVYIIVGVAGLYGLYLLLPLLRGSDA